MASERFKRKADRQRQQDEAERIRLWREGTDEEKAAYKKKMEGVKPTTGGYWKDGKKKDNTRTLLENAFRSAGGGATRKKETR